MNNELKPLEPPLKYDQPFERGVVRFFQDGHGFGSKLPHSWFYEAMEIKDPRESYIAIEEHDRRQFIYMRQMGELQSYMMKTHNMHFRSLFGFGYEVVMPEDQSELAGEVLRAGFRKLIGNSTNLLKYVDCSRLTDEQKLERDQAMNNFAFFQRETRKLLV
jgi:hypothetical protein